MTTTTNIEPEPTVEADDWLQGQACMLDADGNVDPSCEACQ